MHARRIAGRRLIKDAIANILLKIDSFSPVFVQLGTPGKPNFGHRGNADYFNMAVIAQRSNPAYRSE
jgi:hypothetical protein